MPPSPPSDPAAQLQWLVDRASVSDLFHAFARAIDEKDIVAYADCFAEDGSVTLPHGTFEGKAQILAMRGPPPHWGTHHLHGNHQLTVSDDTGVARAYVIASHTFEKTVLDENARAGGWYDATLVRTPHGWCFKSIALTLIWKTGEMIRSDRMGGAPPMGKPE